jgi:nucleoside-diphosphate-sugar epimerase
MLVELSIMPAQVREASFPFRSVSTTGGTGTAASQFHKVLLSQVPHVDRITTTCRDMRSERAKRLPASPRMSVLPGAVDDMNVLRGVVDGGEIVYHLAAWLANTPLPSMTEVYVVNTLVTGVLSRLCADQGKRLVFTSSHSVYFAGEYRGLIREEDYAFRRDFVDWIDAVHGDYRELVDAIVAGGRSFGAARDVILRIHAKLPPPFDPKIYDSDSYHIYCLTKLLAERLVLDYGGLVLRLSNVYGPGDESPQAVSEACHRLLEADRADRIGVRQRFKKLVPAYLGDIIKVFIRMGRLRLPESALPVFTIASQEHYMREDELLRTVATCLNEIRGTNQDHEIEELPAEDDVAFSYDLTKMKTHLLRTEEMTPFSKGVREQLLWLMERAQGRPAREADVVISFDEDGA